MVFQRFHDWDLDYVFPMVYTDFYTQDTQFAYDATVISAGNVSKDIELPKSAEDILGNTLDRLKGIEPEKEN